MRDHIQYINVIRIRLKSIKQNTYWIVRNTKGHSSKKLDPTVLNFLSHMSWMRDHVWYKFYETHTNGTEIVKQNTYLTVVTKGHNSNKPDSQIQFSYNACKAWRPSVTNYIQMKIISIWDWRYGSYEAKSYLLTKGWKRGLHTCHISHCEIKSHRIWPIWKAVPIKNSNLTEFSDHFATDFMKK